MESVHSLLDRQDMIHQIAVELHAVPRKYACALRRYELLFFKLSDVFHNRVFGIETIVKKENE